jgi:GntR family transcriptional repressor for pyruvate dehydrogenase complex
MDRVYRRIMSELLDEIVTGTLPAASWLPRVEDIAARHACSPTAAREAIRALEERRVVEVHAGQGQQVLGDDRWALLDRDVAEAALLRHRDPRLVREAVEALRLLEVQAAMLAARRVTDGDLGMLEGTLEQMRASSRGGNGAAGGRDEAFADAEAAFHRTLIAIAGNRFLVSALDPLHPTLALARRRSAADRDPIVVRLHEGILAALAERDAAAVAAAVESYAKHLASWLRA